MVLFAEKNKQKIEKITIFLNFLRLVYLIATTLLFLLILFSWVVFNVNQDFFPNPYYDTIQHSGVYSLILLGLGLLVSISYYRYLKRLISPRPSYKLNGKQSMLIISLGLVSLLLIIFLVII